MEIITEENTNMTVESGGGGCREEWVRLAAETRQDAGQMK